ncbi:hypothetical protein AB3N59_01430 [Leptospira sp. WS92.C1]
MNRKFLTLFVIGITFTFVNCLTKIINNAWDIGPIGHEIKASYIQPQSLVLRENEVCVNGQHPEQYYNNFLYEYKFYRCYTESGPQSSTWKSGEIAQETTDLSEKTPLFKIHDLMKIVHYSAFIPETNQTIKIKFRTTNLPWRILPWRDRISIDKCYALFEKNRVCPLPGPDFSKWIGNKILKARYLRSNGCFIELTFQDGNIRTLKQQTTGRWSWSWTDNRFKDIPVSNEECNKNDSCPNGILQYELDVSDGDIHADYETPEIIAYTNHSLSFYYYPLQKIKGETQSPTPIRIEQSNFYPGGYDLFPIRLAQKTALYLLLPITIVFDIVTFPIVAPMVIIVWSLAGKSPRQEEKEPGDRSPPQPKNP